MTFLIYFCVLFFFFNDTATTEIYTLSLHDALPISRLTPAPGPHSSTSTPPRSETRDRKSTRLNSSHDQISYAVFCLKKKNTTTNGEVGFEIQQNVYNNPRDFRAHQF